MASHPIQVHYQDNTGKITLKNLRNIANMLGEKMSEQDLEDMINEADRDGPSPRNSSTGTVEFRHDKFELHYPSYFGAVSRPGPL